MEDLLEVVLKLTTAQRGMIFILEGDELHPVVSKHMDGATSQDARDISHTAIDNLRQGLEPVYTSDASSDERFRSSESIILNDIHSLMCIPLKIEDRLVGIIYVDSRQLGLFDAPRTMYFEAIGNLLAATIEKSLEFKRLQEELLLSRQSKSFEASGIVIGSSPTMKKLYRELSKIADTEANILLEGETGTGKGVFARMIHEQSNRKHREFCCINCGVLPENIFESELFGTVKGAYTGATRDRMGLLEAANGSTVFFDEITNTTLSMQAKLLEIIEEKVIRRMGETRPRQVDLRFIIATNRDLKAEVKAGRFREDLYFRISTVTLTLPALRDRNEDIPEFVRFFCEKFAKEFNKNITSVEDDALELLLDYPWPGNIRELRNVIERSVLMRGGRSITRDLLEPHLFPVAPHITSILKVTDKAVKQEMIKRALAETEGNITQAAKRLGVSRRHIYRLMTRYGVSRKPK
jgi:Nif-specific regulatory protein